MLQQFRPDTDSSLSRGSFPRRRSARTSPINNPLECAACGIARAAGVREVEAVLGELRHSGGSIAIPPGFDFIASKLPHTMGALLARACALQGANAHATALRTEGQP